MVHHGLKQAIDESLSEAVCRDLFGGDFNTEAYIDHQSDITLPLSWGGKPYDHEFLRAFERFLMSENVAILGGNDNANDDEGHPLLTVGRRIDIPLPKDCNHPEDMVVRFDPVGRYWTLFNRTTGAKVRFSLELEDAGSVTPEKAFAPELVDVKITNFCEKGCPFCYQQSNSRSSRDLPTGWSHLLSTLQSMKVFEVALGGGEITKMPSFHSILRDVRWHRMIPNFSTASLDWLRDREVKEKVLDVVGGFAYSTDNPYADNGVAALGEALLRIYGKEGFFIQESGFCSSEEHYPRVSIQTIVGGPDWYDGKLNGIAEACHRYHFGLTLLGYKEVGRAKGRPGKPVDMKKEFQSLKKFYIPVSIDTFLARDYEEALREAGISERLFTTQEGKFSCYIDATATPMRVGPSSFCPEDQMVTLEDPKRVPGSDWQDSSEGSYLVQPWDRQIIKAFEKW
jgi:hypothetical protein